MAAELSGDVELKDVKYFLRKKLIINPLRTRREFDKINRLGKKFSSKSFLVVYCSLETFASYSKTLKFFDNSICLGLKISKKLGNAVKRNKIRRRIKACMREISASSLSTSSPIFSRAYLIVPYKHFFTVEYSKFKAEMFSFTEELPSLNAK